jgi:DNA gyrase subunit A
MPDDQNPLLPLEGGTPPHSGSNLIPINIEEEMRRSYLDYSMSVIIGRALPSALDGLKPVHRRVLYTLNEMGLQHNKKYTKCAKVVGQAMGVYHPHGDSAIYDTLVRMAQPFSLRYPLVDGQGNFGSVDGDPPAAMRYTECRMMRIAGEMMADIEMETVDFVPNYDESTVEPTVLPTRIPNLIVNGSSGIAVGMATNIPPHNLTEVVNAAIELIQSPEAAQNREAALAIVLKHVQGPDFPTGGFLYGKSGIPQAYRTGRGRFLMRARTALESLTKEKQAIIVTEIPYQVNKSKLIERIAELVTDKIVDDISDVRDESDRDGMRIVIELKRGAQPEIVLNQLYKNTQMQESFSMIFLAVLNGQPRELGLDQAIRCFIDHRIDVVQRRTVFLLKKDRAREHILEGLKIALDNLDTVIRLIRASGSRAEARENLYAWSKGREIVINLDRERLPHEEKGLTLRQIDAILELQLYRLTQLSIARAHRRVRIDSGQRSQAARGDREGTRRSSRQVRRRAPHANRRRERRVATGRPDRRRAGRGHGEPPGLPQAHAHQHLSPAAPRRHRAHGHEDARGGFCRAVDRQFNPRLPAVLHQRRARLLAQGLRDSRRGRGRQGQVDAEPPRPAARRKRARDSACARS